MHEKGSGCHPESTKKFETIGKDEGQIRRLLGENKETILEAQKAETEERDGLQILLYL
jgi:uncharacterized membrane-anchored protein